MSIPQNPDRDYWMEEAKKLTKVVYLNDDVAQNRLSVKIRQLGLLYIAGTGSLEGFPSALATNHPEIYERSTEETRQAAYMTLQGVSMEEAQERVGFKMREDQPQGYTFLNDVEAMNRPRVKWVVRNFLAAKEMTLLVGDPGSFKTQIGVDAGFGVAQGINWKGLECDEEPGPVIYISAESPGDVIDRMEAYKKAHGLFNTPTQFHLMDATETPLYLDEPEMVDRFIDSAKMAFPGGVKLIVVDTLAELMQGDENSKQDTQVFADQRKRISNELGAAFLVLHHNNKDGKYRGSSNLKAHAFALIEAKKHGLDNPSVSLHQDKLRRGRFDGLFMRVKPITLESGEECFYLELGEKITKEQAKPNNATEQFFAVIEKHPEGITVKDLLEQCNYSRETWKKACKELKEAGIIHSPKRGVWAPVVEDAIEQSEQSELGL
ncbi:AAA domain-containing protein [Melghirimyces profundicolus]|uniref:AAA domain-containing protein n=1 Tax=Melghirimyces profundicolus TaxID=1242148 RepID=A0A2T6AVR8_9BACL|nr:AAA family ATPase [Melghirimyces profundicolus]PTX47846.1 AAA domain-containing protein [Melghirimyces profundicolus]